MGLPASGAIQRDLHAFVLQEASAAIDDHWGLMDVYEGQIEGDALVLTNLKAGTFFPIGPDAWRAFRITLELKPEERLMIVDKSDDGEKNWQPNFEISYTEVES